MVDTPILLNNNRAEIKKKEIFAQIIRANKKKAVFLFHLIFFSKLFYDSKQNEAFFFRWLKAVKDGRGEGIRGLLFPSFQQKKWTKRTNESKTKITNRQEIVRPFFSLRNPQFFYYTLSLIEVYLFICFFFSLTIFLFALFACPFFLLLFMTICRSIKLPVKLVNILEREFFLLLLLLRLYYMHFYETAF